MIDQNGNMFTDFQKCPDCGEDVVYLLLATNCRKFGDKLLALKASWEPYNYKWFNGQGHDYGNNVTITGQHECPIVRPK